MTSEIILNNKKNILTPSNMRKTYFLGASEKTVNVKNNKKYDFKKEINLYFRVSGKIYKITEKKEYLDDKLIRVRQVSSELNHINDLKIPKDTEKDGMRSSSIEFYTSNENIFALHILDISEYGDVPTTDKKMVVYGNDILRFVKDDGYDQEKIFGIYLNKSKLNKVTREELVTKILHKRGETNYEKL